MRRKIKNRDRLFLKQQIFKRLAILMSGPLLLIILILLSQSVHAQEEPGTSTEGLIDLGQISNEAVDLLAKGGKALLGGAVSPLFIVFNILLYCVFIVVSLLMLLAGVLMDWAINPDNFFLVVNSEAILTGWKIVRDFLNLAFILVLLFSAFCTIFQVEKYHLKKIFLTLVIMALLVNFSFPVARFIIDSANVLMYYLINATFPDLSGGLSGQIAWAFNMAKAIAPEFKVGEWIPFIGDPWNLTIKLIMAIIFTFLFAITLLVIGTLLVIRIVVLGILIIFAPVGFVAAIFPSTKKYADDWWTQLFKQSFFGPIMIFMIYLAVKLMQEITENFEDSIEKVVENSKVVIGSSGSTTNFSDYSTIIANGAALAIPIVLLWAGLIAAQKMGAAGAQTIVGQATKWGKKLGAYAMKKGWAGLRSATRQAVASKDEEGNVKRRDWANRLFGGGKVGDRVDQFMRRSYAKAGAESEEQHKKYRALLGRMSASDLEKEFKTVSGDKKFWAAKQLMKTRGHRNITAGDVQQMAATLKGRDIEDYRKLQEQRMDAFVKLDSAGNVTNQAELDEIFERAHQNGESKKWSAAVFKSPGGLAVLDTMAKNLSKGALTKIVKDYTKAAKDVIDETLLGAFTDNFSDKVNLDRRAIYASASGNLELAFANAGSTKGAVTINLSSPAVLNAVKSHVSSMNAKDFEDLSEKWDKELAAGFISKAQVANTKAGDMSVNTMKTFFDYVKTHRKGSDVETQMDKMDIYNTL